MADALVSLAIFLLFYPLIVLCVAITGPHSESERRALERERGA